ncbi:hypothetical protein [Vibrio kanaloae]|uniref:Lipoprotein n=1 Tax=Vibrio kanaloae TaxID=170673 RepID=A0A4U1YKH4_9VIBR|nr:hypothetical protein [Vibrio kanaloae]TKF21423.1 hypothetical protein FCV52_20995 [Vibrio kanaloae]TKF78454.1 hypothetical protein FCV62_12270 [Vibrio kanaloae]
MKKVALYAVIGMVVLGCDNGNDLELAQIETKQTSEDSNERRYCFRNEYPFKDNPSDKDVKELNIEIIGDTVEGTYNWIPVFKDKRMGQFSGSIANGVATVKYVFMQEGSEQEEVLEVKLYDNEVIVGGGLPEMGFAARIKKVLCVPE